MEREGEREREREGMLYLSSGPSDVRGWFIFTYKLEGMASGWWSFLPIRGVKSDRGGWFYLSGGSVDYRGGWFYLSGELSDFRGGWFYLSGGSSDDRGGWFYLVGCIGLKLNCDKSFGLS